MSLTIQLENSKSLPIIAETDVIVLGAGPGGIGAAVAAARSGANTLLVERYAGPGGMAVYGEVHPFMVNHLDDGKALDKPVFNEWIERMNSYCPWRPRDPEGLTPESRSINMPDALLAAEDLLLDAGVKLLYHHHVFDTIVTDGHIDAVILYSKSGLVAVKAKTYIDCTGDADVAALAGCEIDIGNNNGDCQPMTLCFKLENINSAELEAFCGKRLLRDVLTELYLQAKEDGRVHCPRENILIFEWYGFDNNVLHFNTTRVIKCSAIDGEALSTAEIEGRRQMRELLTLFRSEVTGMEQARIRSMGVQIGIRESRRVRGLYTLTEEEFNFDTATFPKFEDAIAKVNYSIDIHSPDGSGTDLRHFPKGTWYEIPYGCIVAKDIDNLLIGGRPVSTDHAVHSSMRVMAPACSVGQAAGIAAALSAEENISPQKLSGVRVRECLRKFGANI